MGLMGMDRQGMALSVRRLAFCLLLPALAGCQTIGFGGGGDAPIVDPLETAEIDVSVLPAQGALIEAPAQAAAPEVELRPSPQPRAAPRDGVVAPAAAAPQATPRTPPPPEPVLANTPERDDWEPPRTAAHVACELAGGNFVAAGRGRAKTCQYPTKDGGKQCSTSNQCEGVCLARSRTCAPVNPLLGCNEVLQADGRQTRLCLD
jgi:hypothetical protein